MRFIKLRKDMLLIRMNKIYRIITNSLKFFIHLFNKMKIYNYSIFKVIFLSILTIIRIEFYRNILISDNKISDKCKIFLKNQDQFYTQIEGQIYPKFVPSYENLSINFECLNKIGSQEQKTILFWNKFKGLPFLPELENKIMNNNSNNILTDFHCPVNNCRLTYDRSKLNESKMILFHLRNSIDKYPDSRNPDQHWVIRTLLIF